MFKAPKGIRNNNPGNIEHGAKWRGLAAVQKDKRFCTFDDHKYGIRAICKILRTYNRKHGLTTITECINRWAPPFENPTGHYVKNVAKWSGIGATDSLDFSDKETLAKLALSIARQENGYVPWPYEDFLEGAALAV